MARQLTPLGRALLLLSGFSMLGYAGYKYGVFGKIKDVVAPAKRAEGTVSKDDFGGVSSPATTATGTRAAARSRTSSRRPGGPRPRSPRTTSGASAHPRPRCRASPRPA